MPITNKSMPYKLLIACSKPISLAILQKTLGAHAGLEVIGTIDTAALLHQMAIALQPDVIIVDITLPGMEGFNALQRLTASYPKARVIISWRYCDGDIMVAALAAGCAGYIIEDLPPSQYFSAIRQIMKGKPYHCIQTKKLQGPKEIFNIKFLPLAICMWIGYNSKETATALGLTIESIYTYRKLFKQHLGSSSIAAVVRYIMSYAAEL
jgi:DNA-binding NarL/FixJ family response regulator